MTSKNKSLHKASKSKRDEFYTQLTDIENEVYYYRQHFKGKTVYCNCDDPRVSNFFYFFSHNFAQYGLKKLIATCYKSIDMELFSKNDSDHAIYLTYDGDKNGNKIPDKSEIAQKPFEGNGDFRSNECIELLKQADIVVTNPPFSLFREYVAQLIQHKKHFLIIGHQNAITYKEIFKLIKENKMWLGVDNGGTKWFAVQDNYDITTESRKKVVNNQKYFSMGNVVWFTNLDNPKRHEDLIMYKTYNPEEYPKYDNYDAINVDRVLDIPIDYKGVMGVPITFLYKYNPSQFEIVGMASSAGYDADVVGIPFLGGKDARPLINGRNTYARVFIRNKQLQ